MSKFTLAFRNNDTVNNNPGDSGNAGGEDSGGGSTNKTYVYTVSGATKTEANGNYYDTGDKLDEFPIYTNGKYYLGYSLSNETFFISLDPNCNSPSYANEMAVSLSDYPTPVNISWYEVGGNSIDGMIVTNYSDDSDDGSMDKAYVYTVSGAGTPEVNGDYWDTGELIECYPSYENANGVKIYCQVITGLGQWVIHSPSGGDHLYAAWWNGDTVYNALEECIYWRVMDGSVPLPTITKYNSVMK